MDPMGLFKIRSKALREARLAMEWADVCVTPEGVIARAREYEAYFLGESLRPRDKFVLVFTRGRLGFHNWYANPVTQRVAFGRPDLPQTWRKSGFSYHEIWLGVKRLSGGGRGEGWVYVPAAMFDVDQPTTEGDNDGE